MNKTQKEADLRDVENGMLTDKENLFLHHIWAYKPAYRLKHWLKNSNWFGIDIGWDLTKESYNKIKKKMSRLGYLDSNGDLSEFGESCVAKGLNAIREILYESRSKTFLEKCENFSDVKNWAITHGWSEVELDALAHVEMMGFTRGWKARVDVENGMCIFPKSQSQPKVDYEISIPSFKGRNQ